MTKRRYWDVFLLLVLVVGIYVSSDMPYEKQDLRKTIERLVDHEQVKRQVGHVSFTYGSKEISVEHVGVAGFLEFFIRKGTHFAVFALLTYLLFRVFRHFCDPAAAVPWSGFLAVLAAVLDEWHQSFTPNRTGMILDVVLDTAGILAALLLIYLFSVRRARRSAKR